MLRGTPYFGGFTVLCILHDLIPRRSAWNFVLKKTCADVQAERHQAERYKQAEAAEYRDDVERTGVSVCLFGFALQDVCNNCVHGNLLIRVGGYQMRDSFQGCFAPQ